MKIVENNRVAVEDGDGLSLRFEPSPNVKPGRINYQYLVIHGTEGRNVEGAIATFKNVKRGTSTHLILGRDGKELVQMVDFDKRAQHVDADNGKALGIELDYTGPLIENPGLEHEFNHVSNFQPGEYIYAIALNDHNALKLLRPWPRFPVVQMQSLVPIARLLINHYGLQVVGHEELRTFKMDPGPAFPMTRFKEILQGNPEGSVLYDEAGEDIELRCGPGMVYPLLPGGRLIAGTPLSVSDNQNDWALVEVMTEVEGNSWLVGWMPVAGIVARQAIPVVQDHKLFTSDGRQYQFIPPHPNNYDANRKLIGPKYLIMHTTDGIVMESTINWFRGDHGASAHLLIGRDGKVVQFVDFDTVAFHCGFSYWEEDIDLNQSSIGIEVDNGGFLTHTDGVWKWKMTIIPDDEVTEVRYFKNNSKLGWHRFTDAQIKVAQEIVQVLKEKYGIQIILGHDIINLAERVDPGPLFPRGTFEELVAGQPGVMVKVYQTNRETDIYKLREKKPPHTTYPEPPDLDHPMFNGDLPAKTKVNILDTSNENWTRVRVKAESGPFKNTEGWIRSSAVNQGENPKTTKDSQYFKLNPKALSRAPWSFLKQSPVPQGIKLRVEEFKGNFALIATLEPVQGQYLEGWVLKDSILLIGEERLIYPPVAKP